MSDGEILKFNRRILSILKLIERALEKDKANVEKIQLPQSWPETQPILRSVAEDLMLCVDVNEAIARLKRDPKAALVVVCVSKSLAPENSRKLTRRAIVKMPADFSTLPCLPLAAFLIELCDSLETTKPN